ncbi:fimbrial protein [Paraburkholderia dinghuensis]|nr:fimbrial protein [Paraburkholderia dinghuensis]
MKNLLRILAVIGAFIALGAIPTTANAACTPASLYATGPSLVNVDPTAANGTVLWTGAVNVGASTSDCIGGSYTITYAGVGVRESTYNTYPTGISGIGVRIRFYNWTCANGTANTTNWFPVYCTANWSPSTVSAFALTVEFVKTGPVTAGGTVTGLFSQWTTNAANALWANTYWSNTITFNVAVPTCTVTTPNISVPMGSVPANSFASVGSVSDSQPFNISLNCAGGVGSSYTNVYTTLTDVTDPSNLTNTLTLNASSTARGLGIQVLNGTTPINFGPDSSVAGNPSQWFVGSMQNGSHNIPLSARYIRTGTVTPGTANGSATFTMSYQ